MDKKLKEMENMLGIENTEEANVKVERKEKGLYERTTKKPVLITEDNKVMLTD
jgi:hypothetical protein